MDILYKRLLFFTMALVIGHMVTAQERVSKKVTKSYAFATGDELHLENKYGNVTVYGWSKNEVSITVHMTVTHKKKENAIELLQRIAPIIKSGDNYLSVSYEIADKNSGFFANLFEKANPFDFDRSNVQIDYNVHMPFKTILNISNKFGDVLIEDWDGILIADIQHGDIYINRNITKAELSLKYGKLKAKNIINSNITLNNGELDMDDAYTMYINSSGSAIRIQSSSNLELLSNKDEITLQSVENIKGSLKFSNLVLHELKSNVILDMKIADFKIHQILNQNSKIDIEQESSEVSLNISHFAHQFSAVLEEGLVRLPKTFYDVDSKMLDNGKKLREINAKYGNNGNGKITITGKKGVVLLKEI
ncbi:hypothetical protein SAMN04488009_2033 [Maribacter sedimenticola]|uniref:Adhesin domain-containing protein n=1 Tax=Maribacter sedimenticola TaxID=228956 RepID=A0ABY1SGW7_9FLAO|nr:hypothetical protein [Maribacter sedimenticola]SNR47493.1 hypothetical protein SAMN04488009_2033 [Maribacter sedimenticola]